jgi:hypothetical protein
MQWIPLENNHFECYPGTNSTDCRYHLLPAIIVFLEVTAYSEVTERINFNIL